MEVKQSYCPNCKSMVLVNSKGLTGICSICKQIVVISPAPKKVCKDGVCEIK